MLLKLKQDIRYTSTFKFFNIFFHYLLSMFLNINRVMCNVKCKLNNMYCTITLFDVKSSIIIQMHVKYTGKIKSILLITYNNCLTGKHVQHMFHRVLKTLE